MCYAYAQKKFNGPVAHFSSHFKDFKNLYDRLQEKGTFRANRNDVGRWKTIIPEKEDEILVHKAQNAEIKLLP